MAISTSPPQHRKVPQLYMGRQTHHHEHGEKDHRGAGVALELAQQHGHQSVAPQQHHVQGVVNKALFAQGV